MSDETSARLSAKLLQGWCMLDKSCDKCYTPLMRDKENNDYCCGCQVFIKKNAEVKNENLAYETPSEKKKIERAECSLNSFDKLDTCMQIYLDRLSQTENLEKAMAITNILEKLGNLYKTLSG